MPDFFQITRIENNFFLRFDRFITCQLGFRIFDRLDLALWAFDLRHDWFKWFHLRRFGFWLWRGRSYFGRGRGHWRRSGRRNSRGTPSGGKRVGYHFGIKNWGWWGAGRVR